jgi:hypothetical protein
VGGRGRARGRYRRADPTRPVPHQKTLCLAGEVGGLLSLWSAFDGVLALQPRGTLPLAAREALVAGCRVISAGATTDDVRGAAVPHHVRSAEQLLETLQALSAAPAPSAAALRALERPAGASAARGGCRLP